MSSSLRYTTLLLSLILCIYVLRRTEVSPGSVLNHGVARFLESQNLSEQFCKGVNVQSSWSRGEQARSNAFRNAIDNIRPDDKTLSAFIEKDYSKDTFIERYLKSMVPILVPWVVCLGLGLIFCLGFTLNWCCMNCYLCRGSSIRCCQAPKSNRLKNFYGFFSVLFLVLTAGVGVAGIIFTTGVPNDTKSIVCSSVRLLEKTQYGSEEEKWVGIAPGLDRIDGLLKSVKQSVAGLNDFNTFFNGLGAKMDDASVAVKKLYNTNKDATLNRIDPNEGTYTPSYIETLGPITTANTSTNYLQKEINTKKDYVQNANQNFDAFAGQSKIYANQIVDDVEEGKPSVVQVHNYVSDTINDVNNNKSNIRKIIDIVGGVLLGFFIANIAFAALALLAIFLVCCGARAFNKAVHFSWCALGLLMIVGWIISTALFFGTTLLAESCDAGDKLIQNPSFFNKTFSTIDRFFEVKSADFNETRDVLYRCIHGDGDMAAQFNIEGNLYLFDRIFAGIKDYTTASSQIIENVPSSSVVIPSQVLLLNQLQEGLLPDSQATVDDLVKLNGLTSKDYNPCTPLDDAWRLNSANCTANLGTAFVEGSADDFNVNKQTCIGVNAWMANHNHIDNRYTVSEFPQPLCGTVNNQNADAYARDYINSLIANREGTTALVNKLKNDLSGIAAIHNEFSTQLNTFPGSLKKLNGTIASIYDSIANKNTGLIANSNCKFIENDLVEILNLTCMGLGTTAFQTTLAFLVMSFLTFFGTLMLFCLAKRFTVRSDKEQAKPERVKQYASP